MGENRYFNLSKDEIYLISRAEYEKQKLITTSFVRESFADKNKAAKILTHLTQKGRLIQLEKGKYILVPLKAPHQQWMPNEYVIAGLWMGGAPYYIGYFTMYNYWGLTEQIPQTVFVLNTEKSRTKVIGNIGYRAIKIAPEKYYGIEKISIEGEDICISNKERTLVDFVYNPIGSAENIETTLRGQMGKIDMDRFIGYLKKFPVGAVRKRAGYILEELGYKGASLTRLKKFIKNDLTYVVLDASRDSRRGTVNKDWKVIDNR